MSTVKESSHSQIWQKLHFSCLCESALYKSLNGRSFIQWPTIQITHGPPAELLLSSERHHQTKDLKVNKWFCRQGGSEQCGGSITHRHATCLILRVQYDVTKTWCNIYFFKSNLSVLVLRSFSCYQNLVQFKGWQTFFLLLRNPEKTMMNWSHELVLIYIIKCNCSLFWFSPFTPSWCHKSRKCVLIHRWK